MDDSHSAGLNIESDLASSCEPTYQRINNFPQQRGFVDVFSECILDQADRDELAPV
jgi:hypothetical protein